MRPESGDDAFLWDIREAARGTLSFTANRTVEDYLADRGLQPIVERELEIIGEAANRVSPEYRAARPEIPWRAMIAQRNVLAHAYGEIDSELIWKVVTHDIPALLSALEKLDATDQ